MAATPNIAVDTWERIIGAQAKVEERLQRSAAALYAAGIPFAVIGGLAVGYSVARFDRSLVRGTPSVDILVHRGGEEAARFALEQMGFVRTGDEGRAAAFGEDATVSVRNSVRVWVAGERPRTTAEPLPETITIAPDAPYPVMDLHPLVGMKLLAHRTSDRVHLQDLAGARAIDESWPGRFPPPLDERLRAVLADPDG